MKVTDEQNVSEPKKIETISICKSDLDACKKRCDKLEQYYNIISITMGLFGGAAISAFIGYFLVKADYQIICEAAFIILALITIVAAIFQQELKHMKVSYCSQCTGDSDKEY